MVAPDDAPASQQVRANHDVLGAEALLTDAPLNCMNYALLAIVVFVAVVVTIVIRAGGIEIQKTDILVDKPANNPGCFPLTTTNKNFITAAAGSPFVTVTAANCISCSGVNVTDLTLQANTEVDWVAGTSLNTLKANGGAALGAALDLVISFAGSSHCSSRVAALTNGVPMATYTAANGNTFSVELGMGVNREYIRLKGTITDYQYSSSINNVKFAVEFALDGFASLAPHLRASWDLRSVEHNLPHALFAVVLNKTAMPGHTTRATA